MCANDKSDYEIAGEIKGSGPLESHPNYRALHGSCLYEHPVHLPQAELSLDLLRACRQVHQEAALLPYQDNRFSFDGTGDLSRFLMKLIPSQARAMTNITIVESGWRSSSALPRKFVENKLCNLHNLLCFISFDRRQSYDFQGDEKRRELFAGPFRHFEKLPLTSVSMVAYNDKRTSSARNDAGTVPADLLRSWSEQLEKRLLEPTEETINRERATVAEIEEQKKERNASRRMDGRLRPYKER